MPIYKLTKELVFPSPINAEKDGLLAFGGDLSIDRLCLAYSNGIFPWFSEGEPILWWSPDPRCIIFPDKLQIHKSMQKFLRKNRYQVTFDTHFSDVIKMCQKTREHNTWITQSMINAYTRLHTIGIAHSVEVWFESNLVGGLYGVSLGSCFFGESMFSTMDNASKTAIIILTEKLKQNNFTMIDAQVYNKHLESLGAVNTPREVFLQLLSEGLKQESLVGSWSWMLG